MVVERPVYSIGKFYKDLTPENQRAARILARVAHKMAKIDIEREYIRLLNSTKKGYDIVR